MLSPVVMASLAHLGPCSDAVFCDHPEPILILYGFITLVPT